MTVAKHHDPSFTNGNSFNSNVSHGDGSKLSSTRQPKKEGSLVTLRYAMAGAKGVLGKSAPNFDASRLLN